MQGKEEEEEQEKEEKDEGGEDLRSFTEQRN